MRSVLLCPECDAKVTAPYAQGKVPYLYECPTCRSLTPRPELKRIWDHVRLTGSPPAEDDLNETQTRALIESYLKYKEFFRWEHTDAYAGGQPWYGPRTITNTIAFRGENVVVSTTNSVNGIWIAGRGWNTVFPATGVGSVFVPFYFSMRMNQATPSGVAAGEKFQGIGWGDAPNVATPWATNLAGDPTCNGTVQLRYNYTTSQWELMEYFADGNNPVVHICDIQPAFAVDVSIPEMAIELTSANTLNAYADRVLIHSVPNCIAAGAPIGTGCGPYFFWTNGSGASSHAPDAEYFQGHITYEIPGFTP